MAIKTTIIYAATTPMLKVGFALFVYIFSTNCQNSIIKAYTLVLEKRGKKSNMKLDNIEIIEDKTSSRKVFEELL
jgi:hypothetical protein